MGSNPTHPIMTKETQNQHLMPNSVPLYGKWDMITTAWQLEDKLKQQENPAPVITVPDTTPTQPHVETYD